MRYGNVRPGMCVMEYPKTSLPKISLIIGVEAINHLNKWYKITFLSPSSRATQGNQIYSVVERIHDNCYYDIISEF